jgi:hypothetical protein
MACRGLRYVSATGGRVASKKPPLWRTCLGARGGLLGLPTASGARPPWATMGHSKTAPGQQVQQHWRNRHATRNPQPVQAIETPRIGETYPPLEWARASQADDTRRDVTRPKRHSGRGVFGQTGCVRRRPGRIDRRAKALGRARDSWQRQSALCIKIA